MTIYTTTEESKFETRSRDAVLANAGATARTRLAGMAEKDGYTHMVGESWEMNIRLGDDGVFRAAAEATFARIVPASQEPNEGDMDGECDARGPEEKDYSDLDEHL